METDIPVRVWNHQTRVGSIFEALSRLNHDQLAVGMGFKLVHNPERCTLCRAMIATGELDAMFRAMEIQLESGGEDDN